MTIPSRSTPGGGTVYNTGPADPYWRFRQLERMQLTAQLLMQQAEERRERERQRLEKRIEMATSAVAAGGDIASPAVQGVINEMREAAVTKKWARGEAYDKRADLLELNFQAQQANDPELIKQRTRDAMMKELGDITQSYQVPGNRAGDMAPAGPQQMGSLAGYGGIDQSLNFEDYMQPGEPAQRAQMPPLGDRLMEAAEGAKVGGRPVGPQGLTDLFGEGPAARMMMPDLYGDRSSSSSGGDGKPADVVAFEYYTDLAKNSPDPDIRANAQRKLGQLGRAGAVSAGGAGGADGGVQGRFEAENAQQESRWEFDDLNDSLVREFQDELARWDDSMKAARPGGTGPLPPGWLEQNPRPLMPNTANLTKKIMRVRALEHLAEDEKEALEIALKQAAKKGKLELYWQKLVVPKIQPGV